MNGSRVPALAWPGAVQCRCYAVWVFLVSGGEVTEYHMSMTVSSQDMVMPPWWYLLVMMMLHVPLSSVADDLLKYNMPETWQKFRQRWRFSNCVLVGVFAVPCVFRSAILKLTCLSRLHGRVGVTGQDEHYGGVYHDCYAVGLVCWW